MSSNQISGFFSINHTKYTTNAQNFDHTQTMRKHNQNITMLYGIRQLLCGREGCDATNCISQEMTKRDMADLSIPPMLFQLHSTRH